MLQYFMHTTKTFTLREMILKQLRQGELFSQELTESERDSLLMGMIKHYLE